MTTRERTMSIVILAFIVVAAFGFVGYQFILSPLQAKEGQLTALNKQVIDQEERIRSIQKRDPDLDRWRKMSLPAETDVAGRTYLEAISEQLKASGFAPAGTTVQPKGVDIKTVPMTKDKKPLYKRLSFTVTVSGDMLSLVDWMEKFYQMPVLHRIHDLTISKPTGGSVTGRGGNQQSVDLNITMNLEALVLDTAEARKTLLPDVPEKTPPAILSVAATPPASRSYSMIAGKNLFYGPQRAMVRVPGQGGDPRSQPIDVTPFIKLDGIIGKGEDTVVTLFDSYHNLDYRVSQRSIGGFRIDVSYYLRDTKRQLRGNIESNLDASDTPSGFTKSWHVVRVGEHELYVYDDKDKKFRKLPAGHTLAEMIELSPAEVRTLGLKAPAAKAAPAAAPGETGSNK